jgi:hypothetical protein
MVKEFMRSAIGVLTAGIVLPALLLSADAARCRLGKGLYEDRLAIVQKQGPAEGPVAGALLPPGSNTPGGKLAAIDEQYRQFLEELSAAAARQDKDAVKACCDQAGSDRAGALFCQLSLYLSGGRTDSAAFLENFPSSRKETTLLWDLDGISGSLGKTAYPPWGPGYRLIDELFLLVMDERDAAMVKYFNLASHASGGAATYMDGQIRTFLKEAPSAVVNQWLVLRHYRPKLKSAAQALIASSTPLEMMKLVKTVQALCDKGNPDCPDILKLYGGK